MQWNLSDNNVFKSYFLYAKVIFIAKTESTKTVCDILCKKRHLNSSKLYFVLTWYSRFFSLHWTDWVAGIRERVGELGQDGMDNIEHCVPCVYCVLATVYLYLWNCCLSMEAGSTQGYSGKGIVKGNALCNAASCDMYDNI